MVTLGSAWPTFTDEVQERREQERRGKVGK
jgi:hypothetical protein